jgi:excisionase family DNA binding protein
MAQNLDGLQTVDSIAAHRPVSRTTLYNWVHEGRLPALRLGRRIFIRLEDFEALFTSVVPDVVASDSSGQPPVSSTLRQGPGSTR